MIYIVLSGFLALCIYVCIGFITEAPFGLKSDAELLILAAVYGIFNGTHLLKLVLLSHPLLIFHIQVLVKRTAAPSTAPSSPREGSPSSSRSTKSRTRVSLSSLAPSLAPLFAGSSWIGPLVAAGMNQAFGSMRFSILYCLLMLIIAFPVLHASNVRRGQAKAFASEGEEEDGTTTSRKRKKKMMRAPSKSEVAALEREVEVVSSKSSVGAS